MIPYPREIQSLGGKMPLPKRFELICPDGMSALSAYIQRFNKAYQLLLDAFPVSVSADVLQIKLNLMPRIAASHKDMHMLMIDEGGVTLSAKSENGFRYGLTTLKQLCKTAVNAGRDHLETARIIDYPAYDYRGLHLDVSRHFFGVEVVKNYLDYMDEFKLNCLHWHLSDDQGWRIESAKFPLLHEVGAYRHEADGERYGGYYSQDEIRAVLDYAAELGIEIIPEIDLPGHTVAMLAAYPALACFPREFEVETRWGVFDDILCAGKPETLSFLSELLDELCELFPGRYFHIGGDEAPKTRWEKCPECRALLEKHALSDFEALQGWFTNEIVKILRAKGKEVLAWDEVLDSDVDSSIIAMAWRGDAKDSARLALKNGNRYILSPNSITYLDWSAGEGEPGRKEISTLENVYSIDPQSYEGAHLCFGLQANLWTEHISDEARLFKMLHPRAMALAERAWNPKADYEGFLKRLKDLGDKR